MSDPLRILLNSFGGAWLLGAVLIGPTPAAAADTAVTVGDAPFTARLIGIDADWNFAFQAGERTTTIPVERLVRWGSYADNHRDPCLLLADGSLLVAEPIEIGPDVVLAEAPLWGRLEIARYRVRGLVFAPPTDRRQRDRLSQRIERATGINDRLLLANGDRVDGRVLAQSPGDARLLPLTSLQVVRAPGQPPLTIDSHDATALIFAPALVAPPPSHGRSVQLGLDDGTLLAVERIAARGTGIELALLGGTVLRAESAQLWQAARFVQPQTGQLAYLSDLEPLSYQHVPFLQLGWPLARDQNVLGGRLRAQGGVWLKGLGMHSTSRVTYQLDGAYRAFQSELALDQQAESGGSVKYLVYLQPAGETGDEWTLAFESPVVRGGHEPLPITVDVSGARRMALIVEFADRGDQLDYANWLDARLLPASP